MKIPIIISIFLISLLFIIGISGCEKERMTIEEALEIANNSECSEKGYLTDNYMYNEATFTWWIDLDMKEEFKIQGCNPACVVNVKTKEANINWRCTGVIE